jgi:hypothetical protein
MTRRIGIDIPINSKFKMTYQNSKSHTLCHCEERSDEAILQTEKMRLPRGSLFATAQRHRRLC